MTVSDLLNELTAIGAVNDMTVLTLRLGETWTRHGFWFEDRMLAFNDEEVERYEGDTARNTVKIYLKEA